MKYLHGNMMVEAVVFNGTATMADTLTIETNSKIWTDDGGITMTNAQKDICYKDWWVVINPNSAVRFVNPTVFAKKYVIRGF